MYENPGMKTLPAADAHGGLNKI